MQTSGAVTGRLNVPERLDPRRPFGPSRLDLHPELEMHLHADELLDLAPRADPDLLDAPAALADRDLLLARALDDEVGADLHEIAARLVELLDLHGERIGQLLLERVRRGLAHELGGEKAHGSIGEIVLGIERRRLGQLGGERVEQRWDPLARMRGYAQRHVRTWRRKRRLARARAVELGGRDDYRRAALAQVREQRGVVVAEPREQVEQHERDVAVVPRLLGLAVQDRVQRARAVVQSRRVDEEQLRIGCVLDAEDAAARGLRLVADDRELLAEDRVHERRLPGVGSAEDRGDASPMRGHAPHFGSLLDSGSREYSESCQSVELAV